MARNCAILSSSAGQAMCMMSSAGFSAAGPFRPSCYKRPRKPAIVSPLRTAIRRKHRDVVLLLLCNGCRLDLEANDRNSVLDEALAIRAFDILDLLLKWGADPTTVQTYNVIDTYKTDLIDTFWRAGVDYTADPEFASYLAHTVNKPLYGWLRRHHSEQRLQNALDVALLEAVMEDEELPASLLLWAGADPYRKVPMVRELYRPDAWDESAVFSSAAAAITFGRHRLFELLGVAAMPDLEEQFSYAHDSWILKKLVAVRPPSAWSEVILAFVGRLWRPFGLHSAWDVRDALQFIASSGGKLVYVSPDQMRYLRSVLLNIQESDTFLWLLRWLKIEKHCEPAIYEELTRTVSMRQKIQALNAGGRYLSPSQRMSRANRRRRGAAAGQVALSAWEKMYRQVKRGLSRRGIRGI
jgi:hypothetical protein